jgi:hypothetical protein
LVAAWDCVQVVGRFSSLYRDFILVTCYPSLLETKTAMLVREGVVAGGLF